MQSFVSRLLTAAIAAIALCASSAALAQKVRLATSAGDIVVELDAAKAPKSVANFLEYVKAGHYNGNLTKKDLQMDSPYNTYRHPGLPPGPIASPGRSSLEAALRPASADYLYFVSRNDGTHVFATTLAEHNRNVKEWQIDYFKKQKAAVAQ